MTWCAWTSSTFTLSSCNCCRARIQELGFKPEKVAELVSRTFNEMVFIHGDVHCDPHAANLFLRKNPVNGQLQLVLLDHGLYRYTLHFQSVSDIKFQQI
jgi:predicted unusual protein kinase regulating ubiquinone biosynthesis (AarF/ABC1/UbiB family)